MNEYVALWHIGNVSRGEIIRLTDEQARKLLEKGAIRPIGRHAPGPEAKEPEIQEETEAETETETEAETETETETETEDETEAEDEDEDEAEVPEIDAMEAIGEAEPEPEKPGRKSRKSNKKEG